MKRSLTILFTLFALTFSALGITSPAAAAEKTADLPSAAEFLNADGTLNLSAGYSGNLDISDYTVTLDPKRGPLFSPAQMLTPDAWNALGATPLYSDVRAIAISGTDVYAGGYFTDAGGDANADNIAKWNGSAWSALGTGFNNNIRAIAISGTDVYAGGGFTNAGGDANADYIAKWNGSAWSALGATPLNDWVLAIAISGMDVYAGGAFTDAGGDANADYIAKWNGNAWSALGATPLNSYVFAIAISGTDVYAGGYFYNAGGDANADYIAKWNGSAWSALGTGVNDWVYAIAISGTDVYAGGYFTNAGGDANAGYIAKWNGSAWSALGTGVNDWVYAIAISGMDVYVGGYFTDAGGDANADYIAKWNGNAWSALGATPLNSNVFAIAISGTDVYAGGYFTDAGGDANADYIAVFPGPDITAPTVSSSVRANSNPTSAASVDFTVTFSESVTGVDTVGPVFDDFDLNTTGVTGASVTGVSGSGDTYIVSVNTGSGSGTIRLDVVDNDYILDLAGNPLGGVGIDNGNFTSGEVYTILIIIDQTINVTSSAPASAIYGSSFTVAASASSGLPVSYSSSGACTNVGADFTMTSGTGDCTVMYDQAGDSNYNPAPQIIENVIAQPLSTTRYVATTGSNTSNDCFNSASPCATITYAISQSVSGNTIQIAAGTYTEANITINKNLTILGAGVSSTIVQAATSPGTTFNRVFFINNGVTASIEGITIQHGRIVDFSGGGGGIFNGGTLTLTNSKVSNNMASGFVSWGGSYVSYGGGIYNVGTLTLINSTVSGNTSNGGTGTAGGNGGGIYNYSTGTLTLTDSTISANNVSGGSNVPGNGGGILNRGTLTMTNSTVTSNTASGGGGYYGGNGGGIDNSHIITITASTIANNVAYGGNGGSGNGGGITNEVYSSLTLTNSIISGNGAVGGNDLGANGVGGGIVNGGTLIVKDSTISNNNASFGGGISNSGTLTLTNSTISGNNASGGQYYGGEGGGIRNGATLTSVHSTISNNHASGSGGGIYNNNTLNLKSNIVAGNYKGTSGSTDPTADCYGMMISQGYNLTGIGTGCNLNGVGDVTVTSANVFAVVMGTLTNNGGATQTHALIVSSSNPALNAIPNGTNNCGTAPFDLDQRGEARPFNSNCDMGAYEAQSAPPPKTDQTINVITNAPASATNGSIFTVAAASSGLPVTYSSSGACTNTGADFTMIGGTGTCTVMYDQAGDSSYNPAPQVKEVVNAEKATLTVTADDLSEVYGSADPAFTFSYSGFVGSDGESIIDTPPTCSVTGAHVDVGNYTIACSGGVDDNYTFNYVDGDLTVGPKPLTITADNQSKRYGDVFIFTGTGFTSLGLESGDAIASVTLTSAGAPPSAPAGTYAIVPSGAVGTGLSNYTITYVNGQMTVDLRVLVVTPDDKAKIYGDVFTAFTGTITGVQPGDNITANYDSTGAPATAAVGTYPITVTLNDPGGVLSNYNVIINSGSLTVTHRDLLVTPDDKVKVYGDFFTAFTDVIMGVQAGDNITATYTSPGAPTVAAVGNYPIIATLDDPSNKLDNYTVILNVGALTVDSAMLTVTADDRSIVYGDLDPSFTFTYSGFVAADTSADIDTPPTCTVAGPHTDVGAYPIACSGGFDDNYNFNYVDGTLTILSNVPDLLTPADAEQLLNNRPTFDWTDVSGALSYTIQISNNIGFTGTPTSNTVIDSTYTQPTNLPNNVTRYWRVQANRAGGPSPWSVIRSFITSSEPSAPTLASPGNNALVTEYTPLLDWNNSTVPAGTTFQKYELQLATDSAFTSPTSVDVSGLVTNSDYTPGTDLDSNTTYYWRVRAYNTLGQYSAWSNVRNFRTALVPPTLVTPIEAEQMLVNRPTFEWNDVPGATSYRIQIANNIGYSPTLTNTVVTPSTYTRTTDLPFGVPLYWRVQSNGINGPSAWSEVRSLITTNPPDVPTLASPANNAKISGPSPLFNWNDSTLPAGVVFDHYQIQVATSNAFTTIVHDNNVAGITNSQDNTSALPPATTYYWRVRSFNTLGHASAWSTVRSVRIKFAGPILTLPSSDATVDSLIPTFTWDAVNGATNYTIQVSKSSTFSPLVINKTATSPDYTHTANLQAGTTYYWRVRVRGPNAYGPGDWSQVFTFTTP